MKTAILIAAYGTSNPQGRTVLNGFERACRARFSGMPMRWAFTSSSLRGQMARQKLKSDSVGKALWRFYYEGFHKIAIQPLQMIAGREHEAVHAAASEVSAACGMKCAIGKPLLADNFAKAAEALLSHIPPARLVDEDVIFMGHGAKHPAERLYGELGLAIPDPRVFIGAMSGALTLDQLLPKISSKKVWLLPLLSLVGKHAREDMAGDGPLSWKKRIESAGHVCEPVLAGLVESERLAAIWLDRLGEAIAAL